MKKAVDYSEIPTSLLTESKVGEFEAILARIGDPNLTWFNTGEPNCDSFLKAK